MNEAKKTKTVFIPKRGRNDSERYVAVNGRRMIIKCGEPVEVPAEFAAVIEHSLETERISDEYISENRREA